MNEKLDEKENETRIEDELNSNQSEESKNLSDKKREKILKRKKLKITIGTICLILTIILNVVSSIIIQKIGTDSGYNKPLQFTYYNYIMLIIFLPAYFIKIYFKNLKIKRNKKLDDENNEAKEKLLTNNNKDENESDQDTEINYIRNYSFHFNCILLMILWYFGNGFYNVSLMRTTISSANTLSNSNIVFIFILNFFIYKKKMDLLKFIGLIILFAGLGTVIWVDTQRNNKSNILGDVYSLIGAFVYSFFATYLKYIYDKNENSYDLMEILGYIGLYNTLLIPLFIGFIHITKIESFLFPTSIQFLYIVINALIGTVICDLLQNYGNILLTPHVVSFGLTITIPISYFYDLIFTGLKFDFRYIIITLCILLAFGIIYYDEYLTDSNEKEGKLKEEHVINNVKSNLESDKFKEESNKEEKDT